MLRGGTGGFVITMANYIYSGYGSGVTDNGARYDMSIWHLVLRKVAENYSCSIRRCLPDTSGFTEPPIFSTAGAWAGGVPNRIGLGCAYTDAGLNAVGLLRFNVVF